MERELFRITEQIDQVQGQQIPLDFNENAFD